LEISDIKKMINNKQFGKALIKIEKLLNYGETDSLLKEFLYIKRLADSELTGKQLLLFNRTYKQNEILTDNEHEYCICIDELLKNMKESNIVTPIEYLKKNTPNMHDLIDKRINDFKNSISLDVSFSNKLELFYNTYRRYYNYGEDILDSFTESDDKCNNGVFINKYPDQIQYCRDILPLESQNYYNVWIEYPENFYKNNIIKQNMKIKEIVVYKSKYWKWDWFKKKKHKPDFTEINSLDETEIYSRGGIHIYNIEIDYTGRQHFLEGRILFEVNVKVILDKCFRGGFYEYSKNPFILILNTIFREAENILRIKKGLPKIGEGWISEMRLFNLIKDHYQNTLHQASPEWLKPQHLDVYIPNKKIAFEYQGRQHFEPVDFFGGEKSFTKIKKLDSKKYSKCIKKNIKLIYWRYDETINEKNLIRKLTQNMIETPSSLNSFK